MKVIVYSNQNCGYCVKQKEFLEENKIEFEERDISDVQHYQSLLDLGGRGTPFTIIKTSETEKDIIVSGFDKERLTTLLIK